MGTIDTYNWPGRYTPFAHQKVTAEFLATKRNAFCFNEQGTGKTASVIWAADYLMNEGKVKRVLIVCPLSIMKSAWQQDLFTFAMHRSVDIAHGSARARAKIVKGGAEFVIINYDGVGVVLDEILSGGFDLIVVDEANAYKNARTKRWKILQRIVKKAKGVWMLTGTPAAQSPLDAFGLAKLVNPSGVHNYFGQFRDAVMYQVTQYIWAPKPNAKELVHKVLQPAIRFEKRECLDLPEVTYIKREVELTKQQQLYYEQLKRKFTADADGETITAVNAAAKLNKLLQLSCGAIYSDTGETIAFDAKNRLQVVREAIEETTNKVLVFVPYTHTIDILSDYLTKHSISNEIIDGRVNINRRSDAVSRFQKNKDPKVLVIQPQAASHGLTLTAADTIIWYAPVTSVETYLQANARIDRPGQVNHMTVIHIVGSEVERNLYSMLRARMNNHRLLVDLYRGITQSAA